METKEAELHGRRMVHVENDTIRIAVTVEGGHVAEILHKPTGINPLWIPPWRSMEPSEYDPAKHPEYGTADEARLLSGIMGHNLCLDTFGAPSQAELAAGMPIHGEAPVATYKVSRDSSSILQEASFDKAQINFRRRISLAQHGGVAWFSETLENLTPSDRPIAWTQHVTLGPPFLEPGLTQFRATATRSKVIDSDFNNNQGMQKRGAEFLWPFCPRKDGGISDFRVYTSDAVSGGFTTHLMDLGREQACFLAWSPKTKVLFGYVWRQKEFPWLGRWEENHLRSTPPWNGRGVTCGMEFGVSPLLESRREMVERGSLFGVPAYRWLPARESIRVEYCAFVTLAESIPETAIWDGAHSVDFE